MNLDDGIAPNHWLCHQVPVRRWACAEHTDIALWLIDLDGAWSIDVAADLSAAEHDRANRFRFEQHRQRHMRGRWAMRQILGQLCGMAPDRLGLAEGAHGKPHLADHPELHFNLSHSGRWALLATSSSCALGIDIELDRDMADADGVAQGAMSQTEWSHYLAEPSSGRHALLLRTWTRKEACLKALGTGLSLDARLIDLSPGMSAVPPWVSYQGADGHHTIQWTDIALPTVCGAMASCAWLA